MSNDPNAPPPYDPQQQPYQPPPVTPNYATPGTPVGGVPPPGFVEYDPQARQLGMFCHLAALAGLVAPLIGNFVGPLIVWLTQKDKYPFVDDQGKESLNFQITVLLAGLVAMPTICIGIGIFLVPAIAVAGIVLSVIAGIQANNGVAYRYPYTLRLIK